MVLRDKEHLVAVRPGSDVLILETMYFADEIRTPSEELDTLPEDATFQGRELDVAKKLVESLTVPWQPADFHNTYRARVMDLIERKREGEAVVFEAERPKSNVVDLMAALEGSLAKMGESGGAAPGPSSGPGRGRAAGQDAAAELDSLSKADLLARAAELDIPGRSKMSKPDLIEAITAASAPQPAKRRPRKIS
jgi:DNA end-binding protein Ku